MNKVNNNSNDIKYEAYVDGSYNNNTKEYSCGVVVIKNGEIVKEISEKGTDSRAATMRNVAGEILGSTMAIQYCLENNIKEIEIYYDYAGIGCWANGEWKTNNEWTKKYADFVKEARITCDIKFIKVRGHSGILFNEKADRLAKQALNV